MLIISNSHNLLKNDGKHSQSNLPSVENASFWFSIILNNLTSSYPTNLSSSLFNVSSLLIRLFSSLGLSTPHSFLCRGEKNSVTLWGYLAGYKNDTDIRQINRQKYTHFIFKILHVHRSLPKRIPPPSPQKNMVKCKYFYSRLNKEKHLWKSN